MLHRMGVALSGCHTRQGAVPVPVPLSQAPGSVIAIPGAGAPGDPRSPFQVTGQRHRPLRCTQTPESTAGLPWAGTHTAHRIATPVNIIIVISELKGEPVVPSPRTSPQSPLGQPGSGVDGWQSRLHGCAGRGQGVSPRSPGSCAGRGPAAPERLREPAQPRREVRAERSTQLLAAPELLPPPSSLCPPNR